MLRAYGHPATACACHRISGGSTCFYFSRHPAASVLDGGLPAWQRAGHATESGPRAPVARASPPFEARLDASLVADLAKVRSLVDAFQSGAAPAQTLVDARSQARFEGVAKEARAGCRSGHAPGSRSVPFDRVLQADGTMRPPEQVAEVFAEAGVPGVDAPLVGDLGWSRVISR